MAKLDPIIAVKDVEASSKWYHDVFGFKRLHGEQGSFAVLVSDNEETWLCLHEWGGHHHPTMTDPIITPGNGLILHFKTDDLDAVRQNITAIGSFAEDEIHINPNSLKKEFSLRDPDGYYLTVTEFHRYDS